MFTMYPLLMTIFSFRYFIVVVRVMAKNMDWEIPVLAADIQSLVLKK
jgi:hypothetical protein